MKSMKNGRLDWKHIDENDSLKKMQKDGDLTEDDLKEELDEVQKKVEKAIKDIDAIIADKDKELMEV